MDNKNNFKEKQIIIGFKTIILGLCLYIFELLSLPIFGSLQKIQVNGQGYIAKFMDYASIQPYPLIFAITGIIILMGAIFIGLGYRGENNNK